MQSSCFLLLQTSSRHPVVGISSSANETELIVTLQGSGVQVYEVFDQKCLHSWSQKERRQWTIPAVEVARHNAPPQFFGVLDEKFLCSWKGEDTLVDQNLQELDEPIAFVLGDPLLVNKVIIISRNASLRVGSLDLSVISSALSPPDADDSSYAEWAHLMPSPFSGALFLLVLHSNTNQAGDVSYHLNVYSITPWHDHPAEKKKRKREEAAVAAGEQVTLVRPAKEEQRVTWRVSHDIHLEDPIQSEHHIQAFAFDRASLSLALYWSNNALQVLRFPSLPSLLGEEDIPYRVQYTTAITAFKNARKIKPNESSNKRSGAQQQTVVAAAMDSFLILTGKRNPSQKGLDTSADVVTTVWDLAYGTLQGTQGLKFDEEEGKNVAQISEGEPLISMTASKGWVAVATRAHVVIATLDCGEPGLASCLNKMAATAPFLANQEKPPLSVAPPLLACVPRVEKRKGAGTPVVGFVDDCKTAWNENMDERSIQEEKEIQLLVDVDRIKTSEDFQNQFTRYLGRRKKAIRVEKANLKKQLKTSKIKNHQLEPELSQNFVCRVAARCLASGFWEPLLYFVRTGNVMTTLLPDFAATLIEHNQIELIRFALIKCSDLDEKSLSQFLVWLLQAKDNSALLKYVNKFDTFNAAKKVARAKENMDIEKEASDTEAKSASPTDDQKEKELISQFGNLTQPLDAAKKFVNLILGRPVNDSFMKFYLKEMPFIQVLTLLQHLQWWLDFLINRELKPWSKLEHSLYWNVPGMSKVLLWLQMVLDTHLTELVMMEEGHEIVHSLRAMVKEQVAVCEGLDNFLGYVGHFMTHLKKHRKRLKRERKEKRDLVITTVEEEGKVYKKVEAADYSIEVLVL